MTLKMCHGGTDGRNGLDFAMHVFLDPRILEVVGERQTPMAMRGHVAVFGGVYSRYM